MLPPDTNGDPERAECTPETASHMWAVPWKSGDKCACREFYLIAHYGGVVEISRVPDPDPGEDFA